jgi:hypothetical protein
MTTTGPSSLSQTPPEATDYYTKQQHSLQQRLDAYRPIRPDDDTAEFLRVVRKHLPPDGKANLADDIAACQTDNQLGELAEDLDMGLLRPMKAAAGKNPEIDRSSYYLSIDGSIDDFENPTTQEQRGPTPRLSQT